MEAFQTFAWARYLKKEKAVQDEMGEFRVGGFDRHVQYYTRQENYAKASFCFSSQEKIKISTLPDLDKGNVADNILTVVEKVKKAGLQHILVKDLTTEDVRDVGGSVARVVIPKTVPLNSGPHRRFLAVRRIYDVPLKMGLKACSMENLNPYPHPFP
jgi:ribosomal protein S12 methylthiotransferase accessory factor